MAKLLLHCTAACSTLMCGLSLVTHTAQVYEQRAVLEWIKMRHTVPHSPRDPVSEHSLRPCGPMHRLLQEFRHEFRDQLSITWLPGPEADRVSLDPADVY